MCDLTGPSGFLVEKNQGLCPNLSKLFPPRQGEEAKNLPGESVTEEQFIDEDGNLVTRKVTAPAIGLAVSTSPPNVLLPPAGDQKGGAACGQHRPEEEERGWNWY